MSYLNADLHCHSVVSDGTLTPTELAQRAKNNGVELWALTDHDEIGGCEEAAAAARALGLPYLTGVEISVSFAGKTVHIVGLGFDPSDPHMGRGLAQTRGGRGQRARDMADQLARVGIQGAYEGALQWAGNPDLVPHRWAHLGDAVRWIREGGGMAIVAHPARYGFSANEEYALLTEFKQHGGEGIEVLTGSHTSQEALNYANVARELGLAASRGSDFHSPDESHTDLGTLPWLPGDLTPVWERLSDRIQH